MDFTKENYKKIKLEDMIAYIEKKAPKDKEWFKSVAMVNGKYSHLKAVKAFAERYFPDIIPTKKETVKKLDVLNNW